MPATHDYELIVADDCPMCGHDASLVTPACAEGHGADCPDRVCVDCGSALFIAPFITACRPTTRVA